MAAVSVILAGLPSLRGPDPQGRHREFGHGSVRGHVAPRGPARPRRGRDPAGGPRAPAGPGRQAVLTGPRYPRSACSASTSAAPRGTTTTGTGESRTIFDDRDPMNTLASGPVEL